MTAAAKQIGVSIDQLKSLYFKGTPIELPGSGIVTNLRRPSYIGAIARGVMATNNIEAQIVAHLATLNDRGTKLSEKQQIENYTKNVPLFVHNANKCLVDFQVVPENEVDWANGRLPFDVLADVDYAWLLYVFTQSNYSEYSFRVRSADDANSDAS